MTDENLTFPCQNLSGIDHLTLPGDSVSPECRCLCLYPSQTAKHDING